MVHKSKVTKVKHQQLDLIEQVEEVAFDEMNLVELPFALLTDAKEARQKPVIEVPLGPDGTEALVTHGRGSVPTALAERVVLGLLWLTQQQSGFKEAGFKEAGFKEAAFKEFKELNEFTNTGLKEVLGIG